MLERLQKFVDEMKSTSSLNDKKVIITYNPKVIEVEI